MKTIKEYDEFKEDYGTGILVFMLISSGVASLTVIVTGVATLALFLLSGEVPETLFTVVIGLTTFMVLLRILYRWAYE